MPNPTPQTHGPDERDRRLQRAIVLQILRRDRQADWTRAELETEFDESEPLTISDALAHLERAKVLELEGETVRASTPTRHLDELELIAV